jgi:integrase
MAWIRSLPNGRQQAIYRDADRRQRSATFDTKKAAKQWLAEQEAAQLDGSWVDPLGPRTLVSDWAPLWLEGRMGKAPRTQAKDRSYVQSQILPKWGKWRLGDIDTVHVRAWLGELTRAGAAPESVSCYYATFRQIMEAAAEERLIPRNPCRLKRGDRPTPRPKAWVILIPEQVEVLISLAPPRYKALIRLAYWSGMRWSEIAALPWSYVDLTRGTVRVERAVESERPLLYGPPKGGPRGRRTIPLDPGTVEMLAAHQRLFGEGELVFTQPGGGPLMASPFRQRIWLGQAARPKEQRKAVDGVVRQAFLDPEPTFHDLRHSHANLMVELGMDIDTLSKRLGHSRTSITQDRYVHGRRDATEHTLEVLKRATQA